MTIDLASHIASLRKKEPATKKHEGDAILFWGSFQDKPYLPLMKSCVGSHTCFIRLEAIDTLLQLEMYCSSRGINKVVCTSIALLKKLLQWDKKRAPSLSDYAGSHFYHKGLEIVFLPPLKQLATVPYGKFMAKRLVRKLIAPEDWFQPTTFEWKILTPETEYYYELFKKAFLIAVDIETFQENATIRCISYTAFFYDNATVVSSINSYTMVLPLDSEYALGIMRKWNLLSAPKVLQNGKYDISYLARYNAPLHNYLYDTANLFHSWYSELPKDLGFLNSFFIREATYWKDLAETNDLHEYYRYNALDTWGTGNCFLAMLLEAPEYAISNYLLEFPQVFPCHLAEMTGIKRDMVALEREHAVQQGIVDKHTASLNKILDIPAKESFNTNSPKQVKAVLKLLGCSDLKSTNEKDLEKARFRHPFNARIISLIIETRKARKLLSTYLTAGKEFTRLDGTGSTILYALNPHGTDTSRLASREHHFWCGLQIHNIPRVDPDSLIKYSTTKATLVAYPGFLWGEADYAQAESRDTAYLSGDLRLIDSVENAPDLHNRNASIFFGMDEFNVPKAIRQISKGTNHGATYNMQEFTLITTMKEKNIEKARTFLKLPKFWSHKQIAAHLLDCFHRAYPGIRGTMYAGIIEEIGLTKMLTSTASFGLPGVQGIGGWSRYCFSDPKKSRAALNSYIAHPPQSLNAQTLNKAWLQVFIHIAMNPKFAPNFKLISQNHDSILYQYREGHDYLVRMVEDRMLIPVTVTGYDKITRTFTVPVDSNYGKKYWSELK